MRVTDFSELESLIDANAPAELLWPVFDEKWLSDDRNIALRIGDDLGMAERFADGIYELHCWFASRGKRALENARKMLAILATEYGASQVFCEIDKRHVGAFTHALGFTHVCYVKKPWGTFSVRVLTSTHFP